MRRWALVAVAFFVLTLVPYLFAWWSTNPDQVFLGLLFDVPDHAQYWAWVTASCRQGLFISNTLTPEANPPAFLNPMMWLLAWVQRVSGLEFPALFQLWRLGATFVVVFAVRWATAVFVADRAVRRTARWVVLAGAGFGWVLVLAKVALGLPDAPFPTDIYTVESNTFWAVLSYPYLALAQGLVAVVLAAAWRAHLDGQPARLVAAALAAFALGVTHAYDLLVVYAVLAGAIGLLALRHRRLPWPLIGVSALVVAVSLPIALYYRHLTTTTALWQSILAQYPNAGVWTPTVPHLALLMGLPLLLAVGGLRLRWRGADEDVFVIAWMAVGGVLPYLPVVFQIKLLTAWQIPLAILGAHAWHHWWQRHRPPTAITTVVLVCLVVPTNLYLFGWRLVDLRRQSTPYFAAVDEREALRWLAARRTDADVVLAREEFGRWVPGYTGMRAVLAHWAMTNRYFERRSAMSAYFSDRLDDTDRLAIERSVGATFVVWSAAPGLRPLPQDPGEGPSRQLVFSRPRARIYHVRHADRQ